MFINLIFSKIKSPTLPLLINCAVNVKYQKIKTALSTGDNMIILLATKKKIYYFYNIIPTQIQTCSWPSTKCHKNKDKQI